MKKTTTGRNGKQKMKKMRKKWKELKRRKIVLIRNLYTIIARNRIPNKT